MLEVWDGQRKAKQERKNAAKNMTDTSHFSEEICVDNVYTASALLLH